MSRRLALLGMGTSAAQAALSAVLLFVLYRHVQGVVGPERFGVWAFVMGAAAVGGLAEMGLSSGVLRFVARAVAEGDLRRAASVVETGFLSALGALGVLGAALYVPVRMAVGRLIPEAALVPEAERLVPWALGLLAVGAAVNCAFGALDGAHRVHERNAVVFGGQVVLVALGVLLTPQFGTRGLVFAQLAQMAVGGAAAWVLLRRRLPALPVVPHHWDRGTFREIVGYGARWQAASAVMLLLDPLAKALGMRFGGAAFAGHFEFASKVALQARTVFVSAQQALLPHLTGLHARSPDRLASVYALGVRGALALVALVLPPLLFAIVPLAHFWSPPDYGLVAFTLLCLLPAWFVNVLSGPAYFDFAGRGEVRPILASHVVIAGANAVLGVALGAALGGRGVALGYAVAVAAGSLVTVVAHRQAQGRVPTGVLTRADVPAALVAAAGAVASVAFVLRWGPNPAAVPWALASAFAYAVVLASVLARHPALRGWRAQLLRASAPDTPAA